jgi:type IV fimbrial biogenesis protein FimT
MALSHASTPGAYSRRGYSLFELLMTLALAAIVFGLGLPSLGSLIADKRLRVEADALFHAVHLARKASIVRRRVVSICPSADGAFCDPAADWSAGWIMYENHGRHATGSREAGEKLLQYHAVADDVRIEANRRSFSFRSTHLRATNGTITICDERRRATTRAVVISYTGRPRVARQDPRGRAYRCAH